MQGFNYGTITAMQEAVDRITHGFDYGKISAAQELAERMAQGFNYGTITAMQEAADRIAHGFDYGKIGAAQELAERMAQGINYGTITAMQGAADRIAHGFDYGKITAAQELAERMAQGINYGSITAMQEVVGRIAQGFDYGKITAAQELAERMAQGINYGSITAMQEAVDRIAHGFDYGKITAAQDLAERITQGFDYSTIAAMQKVSDRVARNSDFEVAVTSPLEFPAGLDVDAVTVACRMAEALRANENIPVAELSTDADQGFEAIVFRIVRLIDRLCEIFESSATTLDGSAVFRVYFCCLLFPALLGIWADFAMRSELESLKVVLHKDEADTRLRFDAQAGRTEIRLKELTRGMERLAEVVSAFSGKTYDRVYVVRRSVPLCQSRRFRCESGLLLSPGTKCWIVERQHKWVHVIVVSEAGASRHGWVLKKYLALSK